MASFDLCGSCPALLDSDDLEACRGELVLEEVNFAKKAGHTDLRVSSLLLPWEEGVYVGCASSQSD